MSEDVRVYIEAGGRRTFASAAGWPGWCRSGKTEQAALEALAQYATRYAKVAKLTKLASPETPRFTVVERSQGNATTEFGAPAIPAADERKKLDASDTQRMCALVEACWKYLDQVVAKAPNALRKGPRGGGRDRDEIYDHVLGAEREYAKAIGARLAQPDRSDRAAVRAFRKAILDSLGDPNRETKWPVAYAARRIAWHGLDHAWEIEDRIT